MKFWKGLGTIIALVIVAVLWVAGQYNGLVWVDEDVNEAWSNVEGQYQRRADLIPNLVQTVKAFANQELDVFTQVTEARAKASSTEVNIDNPESIAAFQEAQWDVSSALSRLLVTVENYPELKSDQNFLDLQEQLEGTENRIAVARWRYNEMVKIYQKKIRSFPANIAANIFGFGPRRWFEADEWSEDAPEVDFDFERE